MGLRCDLIIRDATLIDGTGGPRRRGDVGVSGDRIAAVGDLSGAGAAREVAAGLSAGPFYPPSRHAPTAEVVAVAEALRDRGGLYVTHRRNEAEGVPESRDRRGLGQRQDGLHGRRGRDRGTVGAPAAARRRLMPGRCDRRDNSGTAPGLR